MAFWIFTGEIISTVVKGEDVAEFEELSFSPNFLRSNDVFCTTADLRGKVVALGPSANAFPVFPDKPGFDKAEPETAEASITLLLLPVESLS